MFRAHEVAADPSRKQVRRVRHSLAQLLDLAARQAGAHQVVDSSPQLIPTHSRAPVFQVLAVRLCAQQHLVGADSDVGGSVD